MPSFVLSLALLLLVLLTLMAVSNRELIALTFLGFSTVALPLSIWIGGAIALGFLLGLWILLLFRFGTVGLGSGDPSRDKRRANYGPEDFAVVDERFVEGQDSYDDGRYSDNRYDDVYGQGQYQSEGTISQGSYQAYSAERDYPADEQPTRYGRDDYGRDDYRSAEGYETERYGRGADGYGTEQQSYGDDSVKDEPQDRFSAASGYDSANAASSEDQTQSRPRQVDASQPADQPTTNQPTTRPTTFQSSSAADPTIPADWDDQYREDWTQEELLAAPLLRNEGPAPKLKRWLSQPGEGRPKLNLGGFGLGGATESSRGDRRSDEPGQVEPGRSPDPLGEVADWRGAAQGDRYDDPASNQGSQTRDGIYDADYRVVRQPENISKPEPPPVAKPQPRRETSVDSTAKEVKGDRSQSEWDIESDLDW